MIMLSAGEQGAGPATLPSRCGAGGRMRSGAPHAEASAEDPAKVAAAKKKRRRFIRKVSYAAYRDASRSRVSNARRAATGVDTVARASVELSPFGRAIFRMCRCDSRPWWWAGGICHVEDDGLRQAIGKLTLADLPGALRDDHARTDAVEPRVRELSAFIEVVIANRLRKNRRKKHALRQVELIGAPGEVVLRGSRDSVHARPELNHVEIQLHHLVFREFLLEVVGKDEFLELPRQSLIPREEEVLRKLHRDCAGSANEPARFQVREQGVSDGEVVEAVVMKECA